MLVNCAGIDHDCGFLDFPAAEWERVLGVNLTGAFLMAQRVGRWMARGGGGAIVHISSIDAYGADGNQVAYNASKAGMLGLSRTMAMELAPHAIRSNVVCPGYTATPLHEAVRGSGDVRLHDAGLRPHPTAAHGHAGGDRGRRALPGLRRRLGHHGLAS